MPTQPLDSIPVWAVSILTVLFVFIAEKVGFLLGARKRRRTEEVKEAAVGSMVGATLGLLAFMLAFTFGMAASRYDTRRALVLEEANVLQTAYLRAEMLPQPQRSEIRALLREYVETRVRWAQSQNTQTALQRSEAIQQRLWSQAIIAAEQHAESIVGGLFIHSLNEVIELHNKRVRAGIWSRIPFVIISVLLFVTFFATLAMGYQAGIAGKRAGLVTVALVLAYSAVFFLITDLDRPQEGLLRVSQQPLLELGQKMAVSPP